jgi:polysaccharide export outer membrane protein
MYTRSVLKSITLLFAVLFFTSCVDTRKTTYFNDLEDTVLKSSNFDLAEHIIQRNDVLSIRVTSLNLEASAVFNTTNSGGASVVSATGTRNESAGYLVNADAYIELPMLGAIKADGLTKTQLKEKITKLILDKKLLVDPIVDIRQLNYEVTVLGEVAKPTVITVPNEKISLIKALGVAGDITVYGRKDNVLLIREDEGKKIIKRLDLNSSSFLQSEYYYLKPNDVIYVEANKNKEANVSRSRIWIPTILSAISLIVLLQYRYFR